MTYDTTSVQYSQCGRVDLLSVWESRSLTANTLSAPTATLATCSKVAKRQTDSNFPSADLLVVRKFMVPERQ